MTETPKDGSDEEDDDDAIAAEPIPPLEWVIAGVGLCVVVACLGYLVFCGLTHEPAPPHLVVTATEARAQGEAHLVRFRVANRGDAAAKVVVRGELGGSDVPETAETTFDLVPGGAVRHGGLIFRGDPARGKLVLRAVSYQDP